MQTLWSGLACDASLVIGLALGVHETKIYPSDWRLISQFPSQWYFYLVAYPVEELSCRGAFASSPKCVGVQPCFRFIGHNMVRDFDDSTTLAQPKNIPRKSCLSNLLAQRCPPYGTNIKHVNQKA